MKRLPDLPDSAHVAILGKTGSGKTYTAKRYVEGWLDAGRQVCVVDPTGAWWGLRLKRDGKTPAFPVVLLGGERGDLPLHERSGAAVARLVTEQRASVVVDTSDLTVGQYTRWFIDFAGTLYSTVRSPLRLVIDEAHYFAPQGRVPDPDAGRMLHACNRLMSGGRSRGIAGMLITQRPQKLHKDSLTCADALIAMRVLAPQDRAAVKEWVDACGAPKVGAAVLDSLAQLGRGEGWFWHPETGAPRRVKFPAIATYDSSATPTGGDERPAPTAIDLEEVRAAMAEAVAEAKANDPKALRAEIERLRAEMTKAPTAVDGQAVARAVAAAVGEARVAMARAWAEAAESIRSSLAGIHGALEGVRRKCTESAPEVNGSGAVRATPAPAEVMSEPCRWTAWEKKAARLNGNRSVSAPLPKGEAAILSALLMRARPTRRETLTVLTSYKRSSRDTYVQKLAARGLVAVNGDGIVATAAGRAALPDVTPLPTGAALREWWLRELPAGEGKVLRVLIDAYPRAVARDDVSDRTGYRRSSRDTYLQKLAVRELVEFEAGAARASGDLFDGGMV